MIKADFIFNEIDYDRNEFVNDLIHQPDRLFSSRKWFRSRSRDFEDLERQLQRSDAVSLWNQAREIKGKKQSAQKSLFDTPIFQEIEDTERQVQEVQQKVSELSRSMERKNREILALEKEIEKLKNLF